MMVPMRGLYAILDVASLSARGVHPLAFAREVLAAAPAALQLRAKELPAREVLSLLRALLPMCRNARVPLVCNDRPDLAILAGCDMVHLGQEDTPIELVRRLSPGLGVGVSTHSLDQLERAARLAPTYVAFGPVFATSSKARPDPVVGMAGLRAASALLASLDGPRLPLVAIGGITLATAREIGAVASAGAVIAALVAGDAGDVRLRAFALHEALGGAPALAEIAP